MPTERTEKIIEFKALQLGAREVRKGSTFIWAVDMTLTQAARFVDYLATFGIHGVIFIPSGGQAHSVRYKVNPNSTTELQDGTKKA
jgi:hypothetical protein